VHFSPHRAQAFFHSARPMTTIVEGKPSAFSTGTGNAPLLGFNRSRYVVLVAVAGPGFQKQYLDILLLNK
jgi:hypothetical protein